MDPYQEKLDDPDLPFSERWDLISELDHSNYKLGIYHRFLKNWKKNISKADCIGAEILEIGSGSGGLTRELQKYSAEQSLDMKFHLYESQHDVLQKSLERFPADNKPQIHIATEQHLKVYPDKCFDFVVSLHVIHHIQPFSQAIDALTQMLRISRKGIFIMDLQNKWGWLFLFKLLRIFFMNSKDLNEDGRKSLLRSYRLKNIISEISDPAKSHGFILKAKNHTFLPYWSLSAIREKSDDPKI